MINTFTRKILRKVLGFLTLKSIKKHDIEIIVVVGWAGSSAVRELSYHLLARHDNVRRNTTEVWWDFSVPLCILGYEDKRRNIVAWSLLILKAFVRLLLKGKYQHSLIINLDTSDKEIARFWSSSIRPDIVVLLKVRPESPFVYELLRDSRFRIIYNPSYLSKQLDSQKNSFTYSEKDGDLWYERQKDKLELRYNGKNILIEIPEHFKVVWEYIPPAISVGLSKGIALSELFNDLSTFSFHPSQLNKGISQLKKFLSEKYG